MLSSLRAAFIGVTAASAAVAACSLFTDLGQLSGGEGAEGGGDDAGSGDGGVPVNDGAAPDASVGDGAFCQSRSPAPMFCRDFDDGGLGGWDDIQEDPGGAIAHDPVASSPPGSAVITLAPSSPECTYVRLTKRFLAPLSKWTLEFDLRLGDTSAQPRYPGHYLATVWTDISGDACGLLFSPSPSSPNLLEQIYYADGGAQNINHLLQGNPTPGEWHRITLRAELSAPRFTVAIDGQPLAKEVPLSGSCKGSGPVSVRLGYHCAKSIGDPLEVRIDNVTFDGE